MVLRERTAWAMAPLPTSTRISVPGERETKARLTRKLLQSLSQNNFDILQRFGPGLEGGNCSINRRYFPAMTGSQYPAYHASESSRESVTHEASNPRSETGNCNQTRNLVSRVSSWPGALPILLFCGPVFEQLLPLLVFWNCKSMRTVDINSTVVMFKLSKRVHKCLCRP